MLLTVLCACSSSDRLHLWDEPADGRILVAVADAGGRVLDTALLADDEVFEESFEDAAWIVTWPVDRERFLAPDLLPLDDERLDDLVVGRVAPSEGCGRCVAPFEGSLLVYPGSSCAVPEAWTPVVRDLDGRTVALDGVPFTPIREGVFLSWPGACGCEDVDTPLPTTARAVPIAPASSPWPMRQVEEHASGLIGAFGERTVLLVEPNGNVISERWELPGLLVTAGALPSSDPGFLLAVDERRGSVSSVRYFTVRIETGALVRREVSAPRLSGADPLEPKAFVGRPNDDRFVLIGTRPFNFGDDIPAAAVCRLEGDALACDRFELSCPNIERWRILSVDTLEDGRVVVAGTDLGVVVIDLDAAEIEPI